MNGLRITVVYMTASDINSVGRSLLSNPSDDQPGWFVRAYSREGYENILTYTRIPPEAAGQVAADLDGALGSNVVEAAVLTQQRAHEAQAAERRKAAEAQLEQAKRTLAALDAEQPQPTHCLCWNEGQYGRVHWDARCPIDDHAERATRRA